MIKTKYILDRIDELERRQIRFMKLNSPILEKSKFTRELLMEIYRDYETELMQLKNKISIETYTLWILKDSNYVELKQKNVE